MRAALIVALLLAGASRAGDGVTAVFLSTDDAGKPLVVRVTAADHKLHQGREGLLVWATGGGPERWRKVDKGWQFPSAAEESEEPEGAATALTRGGVRATGAAGTAPTVQLEPLQADLKARDGRLLFLAPAAGGELLVPFPTFLRNPAKGKPAFPAAKALLSNLTGTDRLRCELTFNEGQAGLSYSEIKGLPPNGLPAGKYVLRGHAGTDPQNFTVAEEGRSRQALPRSSRLRELLEEAAPAYYAEPLYAELALEELLNHPGLNSRSRLGDALAVLDRVPEPRRTPHLKARRERVLAMLEGKPWQPPAADRTGVPDIDAARDHLAAGRWRDALEALRRMPPAKDRRAGGLRDLYLAVVQGEGSPDAQAEARLLFDKSIKQLQDPADLFRARVNAGTFLQGQAESRLYNHALQMATGTARPFLTLLADWRAAREQYDEAGKLAGKLADPSARDAVAVKESRLFGLLADVVRTLAGGPTLEKATVAEARRLAGEVAGRGKDPTFDSATAREILAQLDFRAGDWDGARRSAKAAHAAYLALGRLYALENVERLLALISWREVRGMGEHSARRADGITEAMRRLEIARLLAESFRERFPPDSTGATRAAFLARKAFATELLAELCIRNKERNPADALEYAEQVKARALQDLFAARGVKAEQKARSLKDLLNAWPEDTVAIEYFFGPEQVWLFVVDRAGKVQAHALKDAKEQGVSPRDLVRRVQAFLRSLEGHADRVRKQVVSGRGLDHTWEGTLEAFRRELLPDEAMRAVRGAKLVVVVPHHILHYFPFAALVTGRAREKHGSREVTRPRFLAEETVLVTAPSLRTWGLLMDRQPARFDRVRAVGIAEVPGADELPGVEKDLVNLKSVFKDRLTIRSGDAARKSAVVALLDQPGMLFLATHGQNDPDRPLESHLLLPADKGRAADRLTAREIFAGGAERQPELVVMSACYSGLADRSPMPGDDLFGLQRAFLARGGGSRAVVSGLWDVYDDTAPELMLGLFERLRAGEPAAQALAGSQRAFLAKYRTTRRPEPYLHPYFWAVYTIAGDPRTAMAK